MKTYYHLANCLCNECRSYWNEPLSIVESPGTALAREVRAACNKLTAEERAKFLALAMDVINREAQPPEPAR